MAEEVAVKEVIKVVAIAYLKAQCGWSRGVREVLAKCGIEYEEREITQIPENFVEMVEKTGQTNQPCVQFDDAILVDVSGEEVLDYLVSIGHSSQIDTSVPLDRSCTDEEHAEMRKLPTGSVNVDLVHRVIDVEVEKPALEESPKATTGGSKPHIPIKDTGFYGAR